MFRTLPLLLAFLPLSTMAQQLPNWELDSICVCAIDRIWDWVTVAPYQISNDTANPIYPDMRFGPFDWDIHFAMGPVWLNFGETDTNHLSSIRIHTDPGIIFPDGSPYIPYFSSGRLLVTDSDGLTDHSQGGSPFTFRPDSLRGFYKFEDSLSAVDDGGRVEVLLRKWNQMTGQSDTIAYATSNTVLGPASQWSAFSIPIAYQSSDLPDTAVVVFHGATHAASPTTLWLDDIEFVYNTTSAQDPFEPGFSLYPNPTNGAISITTDVLIDRMSVYNLEGRLLRRFSDSEKLDLTGLRPGVYLVEMLTTTGERVTEKVFKM